MKRELLYGPVLLIIVWYLICALGIINRLFLPWPHHVAIELVHLLIRIELWRDVGATLARILAGFALAVVIGVPFGLLIGRVPKLYAASEVLIDLFRSLPALALFPLFILFFGIGNAAKIATTVFTCSLIIAINAMYGVTNSIRSRQLIAHLMGATRFEVFTKVILRDSLVHVFAGMRIAISLAIVVIVATEMFIGTTWGIGHRIFEAQLTYRVAELYSSIFVAGILGYVLNKLFVLCESRIVHWVGH